MAQEAMWPLMLRPGCRTMPACTPQAPSVTGLQQDRIHKLNDLADTYARKVRSGGDSQPLHQKHWWVFHV